MCLLLQYLLQSCSRGWDREEPGTLTQPRVCVYYCSTYYKAVREVCVCFITAGPSIKLFAVGGGGYGTREEPGTLTQGAPVFPGSSRLGIEPKTLGWLVQDPTTSPSGDLIPTIRGSVCVCLLLRILN